MNRKRKGASDVREWLNTIANLILAIAAIGTFVYLVVKGVPL
jgi:flagellar biogenesis protein FliO